MDDINTNFEFL